jgi:hypothetical protein
MSDYTDIVDYYAALAAQHKGKCVYHGPVTEKDVAPVELLAVEVSPVVRAILDAVSWSIYDVPPEACPSLTADVIRIAPAVIWVIAEQFKMEKPLGDTDADEIVFAVHHAVRAQLLDIIDELKRLELPDS